MAPETGKESQETGNNNTKGKLAAAFVWIFFGGTFLAVLLRLLREIATGR
jgi:hypothetical protein